jgi:hypothetical protein
MAEVIIKTIRGDLAVLFLVPVDIISELNIQDEESVKCSVDHGKLTIERVICK